MDQAASTATEVRIDLQTPEATAALARWFAPRLLPGDVLLIAGQIGAGKSHFCRSLIQDRLAAEGRMEDVPSPTYTLVQVYDTNGGEIWHSDLYRLTSPDEAIELGLEDAFDQAICLVEWPDRLGPLQPEKALLLHFSACSDGDARVLAVSGRAPRWASLLGDLRQDWAADDRS